ncbi:MULTISPECIES: 3-keto-5-aminohexanoate cleavage protein [unclassified Kitasatospora]|uniref:3-keto-5-aminohexanoate cleavage protein n=1 Tax=unclassified Kitasatospora TaxID=2633591 RepID=UPI0033E71745
MQGAGRWRAPRSPRSPSGPDFYLEHLKRLTANGIQPHFMLANLPQLETVERLIRAGLYTGPLNLNYVAIGGGASAFRPADLVEFARRTPDGAVLTIESIMRSTLPMNTIAIALGLHVRVGIEDNLWAPRKERITSVQQVEQLVRIADELGRDIATAQEARRIYQIGE